jgi:hypothetical protein
MVTALIHIILMQLENLFIWWGGKVGISFWWIIGISVIFIYFFYHQIIAIIKKVLGYIGIK